MKRKITLSLFLLFAFFTSATLIATFYITSNTEELLRLIDLHQVEALRRHLVISIQTVQSDLYTVHTPLGHKLDLMVDNVSELDKAAHKCTSCHHEGSVYQEISESRALIQTYKAALSYYITTSANPARIEKIKLEAARIGEKLLRRTEDMSASASRKLDLITTNVMVSLDYGKKIIFVILLSSFLLGILVSVQLTRSITRPINELVNATKIIASGSLGHTIAYTDTTEFGELAGNFNAMSTALKDGYNRVEMTNEELRQEMAERKRMEEQLGRSQKMEALGTLAGGVAHDFNNIAMMMIGHTQLAMKHTPQGSPARQNLQKVLSAGKRAGELVKQIRTFSRQSKQERKPVQLQSLVKEVMTLLRASLPSTIEIRQDISEDAGSILADPTQMHQILMNLCANAEHAMRESGGVLDVGVDAVTVDETMAAHHPELHPGRHVRLRIGDTGHGMEPEILERVFEPFFTTKEVGQGTGMGLAVVHGIIASYGGAVSVESTPGEGTNVTIYLRRIDGVAENEIQAEEATVHGKERILFVDDEDDIVDVVRESLGDLGYDVVGKNNGTEALETFRTVPDGFDLVITDQTMPNMTGEVLAGELRRIRPDIPIILCTGFSHVVDAEKAKAMGIDAFCMKPFLPQELSLTVRKVLEQRTGGPRTVPAGLLHPL
jgi:signal transduction histidine kinase/ActR/RegA family two-component response regulator